MEVKIFSELSADLAYLKMFLTQSKNSIWVSATGNDFKAVLLVLLKACEQESHILPF